MTAARLEAAAIREEWLGHALSTSPADRSAAEAGISELYRLVGRKAPAFAWVRSPAEAVPHIPPMPRLRADSFSGRAADWPLSSLLADRYARLRDRLDMCVDRRRIPAGWPPWTTKLRTLPEEELSREASDSVHQSVLDAVLGPIRLAHKVVTGESRGLAWYGQHDAHWLAHYEIWRRVGGATYAHDDVRELEIWAALARSCGWWWPVEGLCTVSERPVEVNTEPAGESGQIRLHAADGPAVRFADAWSVYSWHGTRVPRWVMTDPSVERIAAESNVEVRRCAIERLGWDVYIEQAGLKLVGSALDPGNQGSELRLYDMHNGFSRVLLAVNGSLERDGRRRMYGLTVPTSIDDPLAAAGWTYGLSAAQYSQLVRRT